MRKLGLKLTVFQEEWPLLQMFIKMHGLQKGALCFPSTEYQKLTLLVITVKAALLSTYEGKFVIQPCCVGRAICTFKANLIRGRVFGPTIIRLQLQEVIGFRIAAVVSRLVVRRRSLRIIQGFRQCLPSTEVMLWDLESPTWRLS
jgi:hypothetical protein